MLAFGPRFRVGFIGVLSLVAILGVVGREVVSAQRAPKIVAADVKRSVTGDNIKLPSTGDWHIRFKESELPRVQKISDKLYLFQAGHTRFNGMLNNSIIVVTSDGVVILEGQQSAQITQKMVAAIKTITPLPIRWVVVGAAHSDHMGGLNAFPAGTKYLGHAILQKWYDMDTETVALNKKDGGKRWAYNGNPERLVKLDDLVGELPKDPLKPPPHVTKVLKVGDTELRVSFTGRSHSGPDLEVYIPSERFLWASEAFTSRQFPSMGSSAYPSEWVGVLKEIEARFGKDVDNVMGAHGYMDSPAVNIEEFRNFRRIVEGVNAEARRLYDAKIALDDAPRHWNYGSYISSLAFSWYAMPSVWKNYLEFQGKLPPCPPCSPDPGDLDNHVGPEPGWQWPPEGGTH